MDNLRISLLVIGAGIVLGVYLNARRKSASTVKNTKPQVRVEPAFDEDDESPVSSIIKVSPSFSASVDQLSVSGETGTMPQIDPNDPPNTQPGLSLDGDEDAAPAPKKSSVPEKVISLRVVRKDGGEFPTEKVIVTLRGVGLTHGRFGIFHRLSEEGDNEALFSVASLTEPGSFDLQNLQDKTLAGLSFFMLRPGPGRGVDAFDKMVEIARAVSTAIQGELLDGDGSSLSIQRERFLREDLIQYELKHLQLQ